MKILGIETSCDETAVALLDREQGLLAHQVYSQIELHARFGGVVPELASRDHIQKTLPLIETVLKESHLSLDELDAIAYTAGPGLLGALLVGAGIARSMAFALNIPAIPVHHMEGHLLAPFLEEAPPTFPFVALLVSGGHTQLMAVQDFGLYTLLGDTLDDAAGEAFDKTAKILGLPYPGGPALAKLAASGRAERFHFPRPMVNRPGLDFSFSGLKTFALNTWLESDQSAQTKADIAAAFQEAIVDTLRIKCQRALTQTGYNTLVMAGGVSANQALRARLADMSATVFYARPEFCTDNAAMIAFAGLKRFERGLIAGEGIEVFSRGPITPKTNDPASE